MVWIGREPGIYDDWLDARAQVEGFTGAKYKSYRDQDEATEAFRRGAEGELDIMSSILRHKPDFGRPVEVPVLENGQRDWTAVPGIRLDAIACDGACAGNPGKMEYRAVRIIDDAEIFRIGADGSLTGTNNIAEYLAIIHLAALLAKSGNYTTPIYTDSRNTLAWLRRGKSRTTLLRTEETARTLDLLARADAWLAANGPIKNPILKWPTELWGEIPADFGRK